MIRKLILASALITMARAEFALRDGDTVAFLGDSITAARGYTKIVEHYALMRFPERKIRFINAGQGGDTAIGSLERLQRDVFDQGATVVTVAFGINDIGWGTKADAEHKRNYLEGIRTIIERCKQRNVRPIICSAAITAGDPDEGERSFLQRMNDEGMALAKSMGVATIDLQREMRTVQRRVAESNADEKDPEKKTRLHMKDGIHLEELGQLAMGFAMLKGMGAPEEASSVVIDATGETVEASGCAVSEFSKTSAGVTFTRKDDGLPISFGALFGLQYRWVPVPEINRYRLLIRNLKEGNYQVTVDGRLLGKLDALQLSKGVDLSGMTPNGWEPGGPWEAQSWVVKELVDSRDKLWAAGVVDGKYAPKGGPNLSDEIAKLDSEIVNLQRQASAPKTYRFEISKVAEK